MFVDELTIKAKAGNGGDGVVRWLRERYRPRGGPAGGNGGSGGDVYMHAVRNLNVLSKYTGEKLFRAENGVHGGGKSRAGHRGADCTIDVPIGSKVTDLSRKRVYALETEDETVKVLQGGRGGLGNENFKSSTNRSPQESTKGTAGEKGTFLIEVALIADVGLVGLPNVGKSTLLNTLTNATTAVGAYPFTTLEPHLGELYGYTLADLPGLIEGASEGKGLGYKFLRHAGRTKMLLHCISLEHALESPGAARGAYEVVRNELHKFNPTLADKEEWIVLTKLDLVSKDTVERVKTEFEDTKKRVYAVSAAEKIGLKELQDALTTHLQVGT